MVLTGCKSSETTNETTSETTTEETVHASESTVILTEGEYSEEELGGVTGEVTKIQLTGDSAEVEGSGATVEGSQVAISGAGNYEISGELSDGRIVVNVAEGTVHLILNGVTITSMDAAAIDISDGDTIITLAEGSSNYVSDSGADSEIVERNNAAIYAKDDLVFNGTGSLEVVGNYKNAIQCKDKLKFISGSYQIASVNHGIVGKDYVMIRDGAFAITAEADGIQATNVEETDKGFVMIDGGTFEINSGTDAIQAETLLRINGGTFTLVSGGGSEQGETYSEGGLPEGGEMPEGGRMPEGGERPERGEMPRDGERPEGGERAETAEEDTASTKGLKSYVDLIVAGGSIEVDACDDGIHSDGNVTIDGGNISISAGDDGIHANSELVVNDGEVSIIKSYEGLEGYSVVLNGGEIDIISQDDGINAAQSSSESSEGKMGASQGAVLSIAGGSIKVSANGDGIDANGKITMTNGTLQVQGPVTGGNGTYDYDEEFVITGGRVLSVGTPQMAQTPSDSSTQGFISGNFDTKVAAGTTITVNDDTGKEIATFQTEKESSWFMFSTEEIQKGSKYFVNAGSVSVEVIAD